VTTIFFVNGVVLASWVPHIPEVKRELGLVDRELGIALLGMAVGAVIAMPVSGWLSGRIGTRPIIAATVVGAAVVLPLPLYAPSLPLLMLSLVGLGVMAGSMDVTMNAEGTQVERDMGRPIMSSLHALWSIGALVGAAVGGICIRLGVSPREHLIGAAIAVLALGLGAYRWLPPATPPEPVPELPHGRSGPMGPAIVLAVAAFCTFIAEGAMADWSALYLRENLGVEPALGAVGFAAYSLAMAAGRLTGDRMTIRLGPPRMLRLGGALAAVGFTAALLLAHPAAAVVGFICVGLGLANIFPLLVSAAGRLPTGNVGVVIATVSTGGYLGALAGPPIIGLVASLTSLPVALGLVAASAAVPALLAANVGERHTAPAEAPA
jgi:MFS family permease